MRGVVTVAAATSPLLPQLEEGIIIVPRKPASAARRLSTLGVVTALSASSLLAACTPNDEVTPLPGEAPVSLITKAASSAGPAPAVPGAKAGGRITVLMDGNGYAHLDPARAYSPDSQLTNLLLQRTLTAYRRTAPGKVELVGDLATDTGRPSNGDRTWTFTLRDGLTFEDGSPITSADVAYGVARSFSPKLTSGPKWLQQWLAGTPSFETVYKGPYDGGEPTAPNVATPDSKTIVFTFSKPQPELPYVATFGNTTPVPKAKDTGENYDRHPVATGPYRIEDYQIGTKLVLGRNKNWDPNTDPLRHAYVDGFDVLMHITPEAATQRLLHENEADATAVSEAMVPAASVAEVLANSTVAGHASVGETPYVGFLKINTQRVTDVGVRRALNCAFDRVGYSKAFGGSMVLEPATTILPRTAAGYRNFNAYDCGPSGNPGKAATLMGSKKPKLVFAHRPSDKGNRQVAFLKETLGKAGFEIVPVAVPTNEDWYDVLGKKDNKFDIYMATFSTDWPNAAAMLPPLVDGRTIAPESNTNTSYFNDPGVNAEIDRIGNLPADKALEKATAWGALEEKVMKEHAPLVPVYYDKTFKLNGSRVGGLYLDGIYGSTSYVNAYVK